MTHRDLRVQGFPDNWTLPAEMDEKQAKRIDSLRYHAVGNAVKPPVAEWVGTRLAMVMEEQDVRFSQSQDVPERLRITA